MKVAEAPARSAAAARTGAGLLARDVLLRCWLRETGQHLTRTGPTGMHLPGAGTRLVAQVTACSPSGAHTFGAVLDAAGRPVDLPTLVDLLTRDAAARTGCPDHTGARDRILESVRRAESYAGRRASEEAAPDLPSWLLAEQDLLSGHPWHPMTKSRDGLDDALDDRFAPEPRGGFQIHWYAAAPEVAACGGAGLDVPTLMRVLAGAGARDVPPGWLAVPAHPWQAAGLTGRAAAADLLDRGLLRDLGPHGDHWWATSSLRTVACPDRDVMLKLSMGLRVTNSRRENTRGEGLLAVHTARLVDAGLGRALAAAHPAFGFVLDRGWAGVEAGGPVGLETVVREVPFTSVADVRCAGSVLDPRPDLATAPVQDLLVRTAAAHRLGPAQAVVFWFRRWLEVVVEPLLWLHGTWGIGLEAHLQNVLVEFGPDGLPVRGWYRDNQGWYAAQSWLPRLRTLMPEVGRDAPLVFDDALVVERLAYYLGVNHILGLVCALARVGPPGEEHLLEVLAARLRRHRGGPGASPVADLLLHAPTLPAKANLLTALDGRDEVASPVRTQSVYVEIPNPLREVRP